MFKRSFIRAHDRTTSDGDIQARYNGVTVGMPPANICYEGDPVACPACKSIGVTKCVPPYRRSTGYDGRQANLDGDLCICKCSPPPRLKASVHTKFMGFESHEIAAMPGSAAWFAYAGHTFSGKTAVKHGKVFEFIDSMTGRLLADRNFIVNNNGVIYKAKTDAAGKAVIEAPEGHVISIHLVFEAPNGELNYEC